MLIWPVGLRFEPTEDELVDHHLRAKLKGKVEACCLIPELYIYDCEPTDLFTKYNELSAISSDGRECFFFCPCGDKIPKNRRPNNRMTKLGYWKDTCKKRVIRSLETGKQIGIRTILVYYEGRQPKGRKTDVVMHEYHLNSCVSDSKVSSREAFVLCHIIDRKRKQARSAKACTLSGSSTSSTPSNSEDGQGHDIGAEAYEEVTIETENQNEVLIFSMPDGNVPIIFQQAQMHEEQSLLYDLFIDGHIDNMYDNDGIEILDLWDAGQIPTPNYLNPRQTTMPSYLISGES